MRINSLAHAGIMAGLMAAASCSYAADPATDGGAWSVQYGADNKLHRLTLNYETPVLWRHSLLGKRLDLVGEVGVSYWHSTRRHGRDAVQLNAIPMFQWWLTERFYLEAGIGVTAFSRATVGNRRLGSAFQFGDHLGLGYQLNDATRISLRASHFSNAGLTSPNDGINAYQLGVTVRW